MIRTFVALELPQPVIETLVEAQTQLSGGLPRTRWVRAEHLHLTLRFYGEMPAPQVQAVQDALVHLAASGLALKMQALNLTLHGLGVFPDVRQPRVLWAGLAGDVDALRAVYQRVETAAVAAGCAPEGRTFRPHLTLARWSEPWPRSATAALTRALAYPLPVINFRPTAFTLFRSDLATAGPSYTPLWSTPLG